ncbi:uncharacterized protein LOC129597536 isoform X2 [Paramacrobiotus metropolitanus]|nr:uncharacterized protein LOC129597536 isoform X2 [Paramacrobiotus metropolitanus]
MGDSAANINRDDIDPASISWQVSPPNYCTCNGTKSCTVPSLDITLLCTRPQVFTVTFQAAANTTPTSDSVRLQFTYCQDLYGWYAVPVTNTTPAIRDLQWNRDVLTVRAWITSQAALSAEEDSGMAVVPSAYSARLTKTFQEMGLSPYLKTNFPDQRDVYFFCSNQSVRVYDVGKALWTFTCPRNGNDRYGVFGTGGSVPGSELTYQLKVAVKLSGRYDYLGYGVSESSLTFSRPKFKLSPDASAATFTHQLPSPTLRFDPCHTHTAVVFLENNAIIYTDDEFTTMRPFTVELDGRTNATVIDIAVTKSFILIATDTGLFALNREDDDGVADNIYNTTIFTGIKATSWCLSGSQDDSRDIIVAWNDTTIFLGLPRNLQTITVPEFFNRSTSQIVDVAFDPIPGSRNLIALVRNPDGFIVYHVKSVALRSAPMWTQMSDPIITATSGPARLFPLLGGHLTVIAVLPQTVYQVSQIAQSAFTVNGASVPIDPVQMVQLAETGDLYLLTLSNKIYYGTASSSDVIQFKKPVLPDSIIWVDRFQRPALVTFGETTTKQFFDVHTELLNADYGKPCPFTIFAVSGLEPWYQLDSLDEYRFTAQLWFDRTDPNADTQDLDITIRNGSTGGYGPTTAITVTRDFQDNLVKITKKIRVTNGAFLSAWLKASVKGFVTKDPSAITIHPRTLTPSCSQQTQVTSFVQTTCPTGLSIRLVPQFPCSKNYTEVLTAPIDCPYYGNPYKPQLALYYFDTFMENITVDYALRECECTGRTEFTYAVSEVDAGCRRAAQTFANWSQSMTVPTGTTWGPRTYQPCYYTGENDAAPVKTRNYEILNGSSQNALVFPTDHGSVYRFIAVVLANNYSFCDLQTAFIVIPEGYGDIPDPMIKVYMFIASCLACAIFFLVLYVIYAVSWNENRVGFEMFAKERQPQAWHLLAEHNSSLMFSEPQPELSVETNRIKTE